MDPHNRAIDPIELRRAFGTFVTGVTIVTTRDEDGNPRGMTANSFTSVSLDPPLLLVCIGKSASSFPVFVATDSFAVNLLHEDQVEVSAIFASKSPDKFNAVNVDSVHTGAPVLTDSLTWFDCTVHDRVDAGDHIILIGHVRAFGTSPATPLGFCRGRYVSVNDPLPTDWSASQSMVVGYLIEGADSILLRCDGKGDLSLPTAKTRRADSEVVLASGQAVSVEPERTFLYSVFDVADSAPGYLIYRASLAADAARDLPESLQFFAIDDLPYERVPSREMKAVLRRYVRERKGQRFGIYMDSRNGGRVAMIESEGLYGA
ncbi:flavin reductase (DIM6/NTAB) family NADH-FMN oxidoreductase RutF [Mycoplana sp. BE70]|uniref:flavin reductase family protein n=1 Tax=Mycoplana sp. BE70 TaxID=2817775 RepID=UPI00285A0287|nr:flavin reductase family protein [Mycoplana sp. BE70]MDR6759113.1 flavin reductase (DIM6/NTAB) family NADH-FMN oxidoreductase RutF [Mycoplana sp. BE70]